MIQYTNLNIIDNDKKFKYFIEYQDSTHELVENYFMYKYNKNDIIIYNSTQKNLYKEGNIWQNINNEGYNKEYMPKYIDLIDMILYFPHFSLETYDAKTKYSLCFKTWINGREVILGNYLIDRFNALACPTIKYFNSEIYYEYIKFQIIDPWRITYSDEWREWRYKICGEKGDMNNIGSNIYIELQPIEYLNNQWIKKDIYEGCSNSIILNTNVSNFLSLSIKHNLFDSSENRELACILKYNKNYEQTWDGFKKYLFKTYNIDNPILYYELVIKDENNIYKYIDNSIQDLNYSFNLDDIMFNDWDEYIDGMKFYCICTIKNNDINILELHSNTINITKELFKFLIKDNFVYKNINLSKVNMINYKINMVNKIQKNIVNIERPKDYKANIIKPVFFKVNELDNIQLHTGVTENIVLNLDEFKNKVKVFYLKFGETIFSEIGRINDGVIFKINSKKISNPEGIFLLLNNNMELITTGRYKINI